MNRPVRRAYVFARQRIEVRRSTLTKCAPRPTKPLIADLAEAPAQMWTLEAAGPSGQPGTPHHANQFGDWQKGRYHQVCLERPDVRPTIEARLTLQPEE